MGVSIGTNLKPMLPILFFNKRMKIGDVIVLRQDGWREGRGVPSTPVEPKVKSKCAQTIEFNITVLCILIYTFSIEDQNDKRLQAEGNKSFSTFDLL
jgi:hypothetical protein